MVLGTPQGGAGDVWLIGPGTKIKVLNNTDLGKVKAVLAACNGAGADTILTVPIGLFNKLANLSLVG